MAKDINKWASPDYLKMIGTYVKLRDCYDGEDAIKAGNETYLPRLKAQSNEDYSNYKLRALFFPITGKTCTSMIGLATARPPKVDAPDLMQPYFVDTAANYQWTEFYVSTMNEVLLMGRYGVLIDAPKEGSQLPVLVPYRAENIMKWVVDPRSGKCVSMILREFREVPGESPHETTIACILRHCFVGADGVYYTEELDDDLEPTSPAIAPTFMGSTIDYIPFVPFGSSGVHWHADKPPMQDISTINLSHYLTSADLEWGRHIVGLPTPVVSGVDASTSLHIGGTAAWVLPTPEAKAYYLEFQGQGLQTLEKAMTDKVSLMASISARLVDSSTRGSEAAETVRLRYMNESASLMHVIVAVESGCMMLFNMLANLVKAGGKVSIEFVKDIVGTGMTFKDMEVLFNAYIQGSVSKETLVYNLRRLDAIDPDRTDSQELSAIKDPLPPVSAAQPPANNQPVSH